jgi:hypothetical protein
MVASWTLNPEIASAIADYTSSLSTSSAISTSSSSLDFSHMTIAQIRDMTDKMELEGKLTDMEELELVGNGLMDLNPYDLSYQPDSDGIGYSRSDTGTYNVVNMLDGAARFAASLDNAQSASSLSGAAEAIQQYEESQVADTKDSSTASIVSTEA